ncbi:MAG: chorismate mutase [Candidatus Moraniibacteriota bacterium]
MKKYRKIIAFIDYLILSLVSYRMKIALKIEQQKRKSNLPILNVEVEEAKIKKLRRLAENKKINPDFAENIFREIMKESVRIQEEQRNLNKN